MDKNREVPERVLEWMNANMMTAPLYYKNEGKKTEIICGACGMSYTHERKRQEPKPTKRNKGTCEWCGHIGEYAWKKETVPKWETEHFYYFDKTEDNDIVIRHFEVTKRVAQHEAERVTYTECRRMLCKPGKPETWRKDYRWNGHGMSWDHYWKKNTKASTRGIENGAIYPGYREVIKTSTIPYFNETDYSMLRNYWFGTSFIVASAMAYAASPAIEMMAKMGLEGLVRELISTGSCKWINRRGKSMKEVLRLKDKKHINELVKAKGSIKALELLQLKEKGKLNTDEWARNMIINYTTSQKDVEVCLKYMSCEQLRNRIESYRPQFDSKYREKSDYEVIREYADYLTLRESLGYDMTNSIYIHPRNLYENHMKMIAENKARQDEIYIVKKNKEFGDIPKRYAKLNKTYAYEAAGLCIMIPHNAGEIITEGREMHHCVGGDTYLKKHNKGESVILFLRHTDNPSMPYATIEIIGTTIRQWYEAHDKKPHQDEIEPWLTDYIAHLKGEEKHAAVS